jgi:hypothetical protein
MAKSKFQELIDAATELIAKVNPYNYQESDYLRIRAAVASLWGSKYDSQDDAAFQDGFETATSLVLEYFVNEERRYREMAECFLGDGHNPYNDLANSAATFRARLQDDDHIKEGDTTPRTYREGHAAGAADAERKTRNKILDTIKSWIARELDDGEKKVVPHIEALLATIDEREYIDATNKTFADAIEKWGAMMEREKITALLIKEAYENGNEALKPVADRVAAGKY